MESDQDDLLCRDVVGYDPTSGTYHVQHDWDGRSSLTYTILSTVAAVTGDEPQELEPLSEIVDPDALERVFEPGRVRGGAKDGCLMIRFNRCLVKLFADGHLEVDPPADG